MSEFPREWPAQVSAPCIHARACLRSHCIVGCTFRMDQLPEPLNCRFSWTARALIRRHSCTFPQPHAPRCREPQDLHGAAPARGGGEGPGGLQSFSRSTEVPSSTQRDHLKATSQSSRSFQHLTQCFCVEDY